MSSDTPVPSTPPQSRDERERDFIEVLGKLAASPEMSRAYLSAMSDDDPYTETARHLSEGVPPPERRLATASHR